MKRTKIEDIHQVDMIERGLNHNNSEHFFPQDDDLRRNISFQQQSFEHRQVPTYRGFNSDKNDELFVKETN